MAYNDQYLGEYTLSQTLPDRYQMKFLALEQPDKTTLHWMDQAKELSSNIWLQLWRLVARWFLSFFLTQTSIDGYNILFIIS